MNFEIVKLIAYEKDNSVVVRSKPRNELQGIRLSGLYELLILLRIILTLNLQTGWIHQDEFTNSLEVVAGDYFDLQVFKSPSFNSTFPTHSMALLHTTVYMPYLMANYFLSYDHPLGKERIPNSKLLILIPRLFHLLLSFLVDYILIKFCELNDSSKPPKRFNTEEDITTTTTTTSGSDESSRGNQILSSTSNHSQESSSGDRTESSTRSTSSPPPAPPSSTSVEDPSQNESTNPSHIISLNNDYSIRLVTLASSQVLLVFATRTHPSSINLLLFALLLYFVSASFHAYEEYIPFLEKYHKTPKQDAVRKVYFLRLMKRTGYSPINRLHWIALITVVGLFNDPEFFVSYGCIPLFFYMQRGISNRYVGMKYFHARIFTFLVYFFTFSIPFILWDSFYHGKVCIDDFRELSLSPESFVITPVNYFASKTSQFRDFWAYPKIFVLYILLFNILGVMGLISFVKELYDVIFAEWRHKPNLDSHWTFLNCSLFLPLFFLIQANGNSYSAFDLVPLIFPLVYMHGHKIPLVSRFSNKIGFAWFISNLVGIVYFGYASQGGIVTSFLDLYNNLVPIRFNETQVDITFSQMTAIPPTFTLAIPSKWKTLVPTQIEKVVSMEDAADLDLDGLPSELHKTVLKLETSSKVRVYHTGHSPLPMSHLERDLHRLVVNQEQSSELLKKVSFLLIPYTYGRESEETFRLLKLTHVKTYWNHMLIDFFGDDGISRNAFNFGLSLYRMEKVVYSTSKLSTPGSNTINDTTTDDGFSKMFQFHDAFYQLLRNLVDLVTLILTFGLFFTSYLVFLT